MTDETKAQLDAVIPKIMDAMREALKTFDGDLNHWLAMCAADNSNLGLEPDEEKIIKDPENMGYVFGHVIAAMKGGLDDGIGPFAGNRLRQLHELPAFVPAVGGGGPVGHFPMRTFNGFMGKNVHQHSPAQGWEYHLQRHSDGWRLQVMSSGQGFGTAKEAADSLRAAADAMTALANRCDRADMLLSDTSVTEH